MKLRKTASANTLHGPGYTKLLYMFTGLLIMWTPLTSFLRHAGYPILSIEAFLAYAIFSIVGIAGGLIMLTGSTILRVLSCSALIVIFIDLQFGWFRLLYLFIGFSSIALVAWAIQKYLSQILLAFFSVTFVITIFTQASPFWIHETASPAETKGAALPAIFHFILDEHIGIESIPIGTDPERSFANFLLNTYRNRGFVVYPRAYSASESTSISLPLVLSATLDKQASRNSHIFRHVLDLNSGYILHMLKKQGYRVHVVQSRFIDFCRPGGKLVVDECHTYDQGNVSAIRDEADDTLSRLSFILMSMKHRSKIYELITNRFGTNSRVAVGPVSTVAAMRGVEKTELLIRKATQGDAYLVHLLLPHKPYSYTSNCALRSAGQGWPQPNLRYPRYLAQTKCATKIMTRFLDLIDEAVGSENSVVVIHGDHGSRLADDEKETMTLLGTLFAVRLPSESGRIDRRPIPVHKLVHSILIGKSLPQYDDPQDMPMTYGNNAPEPFAHGVSTDSW